MPLIEWKSRTTVSWGQRCRINPVPSVDRFSRSSLSVNFAVWIRSRWTSLSGFLTLALLCATLFGPTIVALGEDGDAESQELEIETIKMPKVIEFGVLHYPRRALSKAVEGWVYLNFFVDTEGKPYQISVADRSGSPLFEAAAIRALKGTKFQPGEYNGKKIDHEYNMQYTFELEGKTALFANSFKRRFYDVVHAISNKQKTKAEDGLEILLERRRTLHEDAMYWTAKYYFDQAWGTVSEQLLSVSRAIGHDKARRYMDVNLHHKLLWSKLVLQLQQKKYVSALDTIERFDGMKSVDEALLQQVAKLRRAIDDLRSSSTIISDKGTISSSGGWSHELIRNRFSVVEVEGAIEEFNLTCERNRLRFRYEPDQEYSYNASSGTCRVGMTGDPGTSFRFVQL